MLPTGSAGCLLIRSFRLSCKAGGWCSSHALIISKAAETWSNALSKAMLLGPGLRADKLCLLHLDVPDRVVFALCLQYQLLQSSTSQLLWGLTHLWL